MKKVLAIIATIAVVLTLTSCGGSYQICAGVDGGVKSKGCGGGLYSGRR
tara:strand:- start:514 stop:660 length:147 start_codon:yes stop_codon:yes gene_type:complete